MVVSGEEDKKGSGPSGAKMAADTARAAKTLSKAAAKAGTGNLVGAAADLAKDPKTLQHILAVALGVILILTLVLASIPMLVYGAMEQFGEQVSEELYSNSDGDIIYDSTLGPIQAVFGAFLKPLDTLGEGLANLVIDFKDFLQGNYSKAPEDGTEDDSETGLADLDAFNSDQSNREAIQSKIAATENRILKRIDSLEAKLKSDIWQAQALVQAADPDHGAAASGNMQISVTRPDLYLDSLAVQALAAYTVQYGGNLNSIADLDLGEYLKWLGYWAWSATGPWSGTFLPQPIQDAYLADLEALKCQGATQEEIDAQKDVIMATYQDFGTALLNYLIVVDEPVINVWAENISVDSTTIDPETGKETTHTSWVTVWYSTVTYNIRIVDVNTIASEVIGFWDGPNPSGVLKDMTDDDGLGGAAPTGSIFDRYSFYFNTRDFGFETTTAAGNELREVTGIGRDDTGKLVESYDIPGSGAYRRTRGHQQKYYEDLVQTTSSYLGVSSFVAAGDGSDILSVAISQIDYKGGDKFNEWYGLERGSSWCAAFVSWCADQCGYIDSGVIPKFSGCLDGTTWFQGMGQWASNGQTPQPGWIVFYDWGQTEVDRSGRHVGIVESFDGTTMTTIEGNTSYDGMGYLYGGVVTRKTFRVGSYRWNCITGYGTPQYPDSKGELDQFTKRLKSLFATSGDWDWNVWYEELGTGEYAQYTNMKNSRMPAGQLMQLWIAGAVYDQAVNGQVVMDDEIRNKIITMLTTGDEAAGNDLVGIIGMEAVNDFAQTIGCGTTTMNHLLGASGTDENWTNARDCATALRLIYQGEFVNSSISQQIEEILTQNTSLKMTSVVSGESELLAGSIEGVPFWSEQIIALVHNREKPYILCILCNYKPGADPELQQRKAVNIIRSVGDLAAEF